MDVRGPGHGQPNKSTELPQLRSEIRRIESAQADGPSDHLPGPNASEHVRDPEISRLTEQLKGYPEIRETLVSEVAEKIKDGSYLTRANAERAAKTLLGITDEE